MKNTLKNEKEIGNQKKESFIENHFDLETIDSIVDFAKGCFVALVGLGVLHVILYGLSYIGVACTVTATIWMVGCGAGAIICGLIFLGNIWMSYWSCFTMPVPEFWFATALLPGIFFIRSLIFV
ncbi:hypothetical protein [Acetobacterium wieringae]|uniref:hypothetical protein n=1 Tax=Acetobacterium wieringae TaxID=52694 RepID=UPI0026EA617A|nr:hypothetical protein [Acetobacterium wieringae]